MVMRLCFVTPRWILVSEARFQSHRKNFSPSIALLIQTRGLRLSFEQFCSHLGHTSCYFRGSPVPSKPCRWGPSGFFWRFAFWILSWRLCPCCCLCCFPLHFGFMGSIFFTRSISLEKILGGPVSQIKTLCTFLGNLWPRWWPSWSLATWGGEQN